MRVSSACVRCVTVAGASARTLTPTSVMSDAVKVKQCFRCYTVALNCSGTSIYSEK